MSLKTLYYPDVLHALVNAFVADTRAFAEEVRASVLPAPRLVAGLHTYKFGWRRIHLSISPDGSGVLFVDVTDAIHLSRTAVEIAKLLLDGVKPARVRAWLRRTYSDAPADELDRAHHTLSTLVAHVSNPMPSCTTCAVELPRTPLFSTRAKHPYKVDLALTYGCNNACAHCYNEPDRYDMASMSGDEWKKILVRLKNIGVPHIIFTGGEATLHPNLTELISFADEQGQITGLNSNGRRLHHRPYADELLDAGLNHIQITIESSRAEVHDEMQGGRRAFHQTVKGIENAQAAGLHTITNTTLTLQNKDHVEETIDFLHSLGLHTFAMNGMIYSGGGTYNPVAIPEEDMAPILVRVRDRAAELGMRFLWYTPTEYCRMSPVELEIGAKRCNAGEYSMAVEPNGDVLPCQSYYTSAGNLLRDPWEDIWKGELFTSFRHREDDPKRHLPEKCWECPDLPLCGGGCRIEREARDDPQPTEALVQIGIRS